MTAPNQFGLADTRGDFQCSFGTGRAKSILVCLPIRGQALPDQAYQGISCRVCGEPVSLTSDTVVNEDGKAVHEQCYVTKITSSTGTQEEAP
jgi:hypothetical protein